MREYGQACGALFDAVQSESFPKNEKRAVWYATEPTGKDNLVSEAAGVDVSGWSHSVDSFAMRKVHKDHGHERSEAPRGQSPITKEDWAKLPEIVRNYDTVDPAGTDQHDTPLIRYSKRFNGTTYYVEEVRGKRRELAAKTMWKTRTAMSGAEGPALTSQNVQPESPQGNQSVGAAAPSGNPDGSDDPNSPNYRYRDTGIIAGARKFNVAATFKAAAKDGQRVRTTDVDWDEVEENPRQARELITKSHLFGKVDWEELKTRGMEPGAGFLVDRVYASIQPAPDDSPQARRDYALGIESVRDRLESCRTPEEISKTLNEMRLEWRGEMLSATDAPAYQEAMDRYKTLRAKADDIKAQADAILAPAIAIRNEINRLEYEQMKWGRRRKGARNPDLDQQIARLRAKEGDADAPYKAFRERNNLQTKKRDLGGGGHVYLNDDEWEARKAYESARSILSTARAQNVISNPTTRAWMALGPRFHAILQGKSDAYAGHRANVRMGKVPDWSWAEKDAKPGAAPKKRDARFQLQVADHITRDGGKPITAGSTQALKDLFNLRDVQSGNWVLKDQGSAQWHVERAAEAFSDLADLVGADPKTVAMNGRMALAFGARGKGNAGFGGSARAHYEAVERVINITKMKGGGTLAHEWFHALDNLLAEMHGGTSGVDVFASEGALESLPPAVADAFRSLHEAMHAGTLRASRTLNIDDRDRRLAVHNLHPNNVRPGLGKNIADAGDLQSAIEVVNTAEDAAKDAWERRRGKWTKKDSDRYESWRKIAAAHYGPKDATEVQVHSGPPLSSFALEARLLDGQKKKPYWSSPREMAARAFQSWAEDRLSEQGRRNDYLSAKADNRYYRSTLFGDSKPFPEGAERERINAAFDQIFASLRAEKTMEKALRGSPRVLFVSKNKGPLQKGGPFSAFPKLQAPYGCGITPLGVTSAAPGSGRTSPGDPEGCLSSIHHRVVFFKAISRRRKRRVCEDADALVREHERLVRVLRSPEHEDDIEEAQEQERELAGYRDTLRGSEKSGIRNLANSDSR